MTILSFIKKKYVKNLSDTKKTQDKQMISK